MSCKYFGLLERKQLILHPSIQNTAKTASETYNNRERIFKAFYCQVEEPLTDDQTHRNSKPYQNGWNVDRRATRYPVSPIIVRLAPVIDIVGGALFLQSFHPFFAVLHLQVISDVFGAFNIPQSGHTSSGKISFARRDVALLLTFPADIRMVVASSSLSVVVGRRLTS